MCVTKYARCLRPIAGGCDMSAADAVMDFHCEIVFLYLFRRIL